MGGGSEIPPRGPSSALGPSWPEPSEGDREDEAAVGLDLTAWV